MRFRAFFATYRKMVRRRIYRGRRVGLRGQPESVAAFFALIVPLMLWTEGHAVLALVVGGLVTLPILAIAAFVEWTALLTSAERQDKIYKRHTRKMLSREYQDDD